MTEQTQEKIYTDRQKEEGRLLIREAGIELAVLAFLCCGGFCAVIYGLTHSITLPFCASAGGGIFTVLLGLIFSSEKKHCRGLYLISVILGTLPFVGAVVYSICNKTVPHIKYFIYDYQLGWLASMALTLVMCCLIIHYLFTVFLTYFKLFQSEDVDAYLGKSTSTSSL